MAVTDPVWDEFRRARVRIVLGDDGFDLAPAHEATAGAYLPGVAGPVHILTAHSPMGRPADPAANTAANERLAATLTRRDRVRFWPAIGYGGGPFGAARTWSEDGFAIFGLTDAEALGLAREHRQRAIYTWRNEPGGFRLVACDGSADEPRGWTATRVRPADAPLASGSGHPGPGREREAPR